MITIETDNKLTFLIRQLVDFLEGIDDPRRDAVLAIYRDHEDLFHKHPGSTHIHQCWEGGLADHLADGFRLIEKEYDMLSTLLWRRKETLPFTMASAQIAWFCHDAEKLYVYSPDDARCQTVIADSERRWANFQNACGAAPTVGRIDHKAKGFKEELKWVALDHWQQQYALVLTDAERNAVKYTHGEGDDYRNDRRVMNELAAFVGNVDRTSARILYNSGKDLG